MRAAALADRGWQHAALLRVQGALEGAGALALHAAAHAEDLYPAPELRPHRTLDLLIAPSRTFAALERLSRRGYQIDPTLSKPDKGWLTLRLRDPRDARVVIDLHRGFPPLPGVPPRGDAEVRSALDAEQLCRRAAGTRLEANDAVVVQALGAFAYDDRWVRLEQNPAAPAHTELWDAAHSPIALYARRRVVILAAPRPLAGEHGKVPDVVREQRASL